MKMMEKKIDLVDINRELSALWEGEESKDKIRARLFNFILYTQKSERTPYYQSLLDKVVAKFPSRVILIVEDSESKQDYLKTEVTSKPIREGELQIYCEQITIEAGGSLKERIPYIVLPHIVPDLPLYLLWTRHLKEKSPLFEMLDHFASRIIFDSEAAVNLKHFSQTILSFLDKFHCEIGDLNWAALSGWRKLFATTFSDPQSVAHLESAQTIRITYNRSPQEFFKHNEIKAAYLQAWIAAQMGWSFKHFEVNEGNLHITYNRVGGEVKVHLAGHKEPNHSPGTLTSIDIDSALHGAHFTFKRHESSRRISIQHSDANHCELPYATTLAGFRPGEEIIEEIFYGKASAHYKNTLKILTEIPWEVV